MTLRAQTISETVAAMGGSGRGNSCPVRCEQPTRSTPRLAGEHWPRRAVNAKFGDQDATGDTARMREEIDMNVPRLEAFKTSKVVPTLVPCTQDRAWIAFFQQSMTLLQDFEQNPALCKKGEEDRRPERAMALVLLEASHQLAAQGAPSKEAEIIRASLHTWLSEVAFEDSCLSPERARELRQWAEAHNLESEAGRMERRIRGDGA